MPITAGLSLADLFSIIAGVSLSAGVVGYVIGAVRQFFGHEPHFDALIRHFSMLGAIGSGAFVLADRVT